MKRRAIAMLALVACTKEAPPAAPPGAMTPPKADVPAAVVDPCAGVADRLKRVPELVAAKRHGRLVRLVEDVDLRCPNATVAVRADFARALLALGDRERATSVANEPALASDRQALLALVGQRPALVDEAAAARELGDTRAAFAKNNDAKGAFAAALTAASRAPKPGAALLFAIELAPLAGEAKLVPELRDRALFALERATKTSATTALPATAVSLERVAGTGMFTFRVGLNEVPHPSFSVRNREGREVATFSGSGFEPLSLGYTYDGGLRVLDSADGSTSRIIAEGMGPLRRMSASRTGARALVFEGFDAIGEGSYHVWDTASGKLLLEEKCGPICADVGLSPSGRYLARFASTDPPALTIRDIERKSDVDVRLKPSMREYDDGIGFRDDDSVWVREGEDLTIFDPKTGKKISGVRVPPQGEVLLVEPSGAVWLKRYGGDGDAMVRVEGKQRLVLGETAGFCDFKVPEPHRSFCGNRVGIKGAYSVLALDGGSKKLVATPTAPANDVAWSVDGGTLLAASALAPAGEAFGIAQWRFPSAHLGAPARGHRDVVTALAAGSGSRIFSGGEDGTVRAWQGVTEEWTSELRTRVMRLAADRKGQLVAASVVSSEDTIAVILDAKDGRVASKVRASLSTGQFGAPLAFNASGTLLFTGDAEGNLNSWNPKTGGARSTQRFSSGGIEAIEPSPVSDVLAVAAGFKVLLVDTAGPAAPIAVEGCAERVEDFAFSPDGQTLFTACGSTVTEVDTATGKLRRAWSLASPARRLAFAQEAKLIAVATQDGVVLLQQASAAPLATMWMDPSLRSGVVRADTGHVQIEGSAIKQGLSCKIGTLGHPFELCEERFVVPDLLERLLRGDRSFALP